MPSTASRKLHIAFAIPSLASGGAGRVILGVARGLVARGYAVDIVMFRTSIHHPEEVPAQARLFVADDAPDQITQSKPSYAALRARIASVESRSRRFGRLRLARALNWHPLVLPTRVQCRQACQMANYIDKQKPDIVFATLTRSVLSALFARRLLDNPPPVIPIIQGVIEAHRKHKQIRYRALFPDAAHVVAVSNGVADSVAARIGVRRSKITTIYNPVVEKYRYRATPTTRMRSCRAPRCSRCHHAPRACPPRLSKRWRAAARASAPTVHRAPRRFCKTAPSAR